MSPPSLPGFRVWVAIGLAAIAGPLIFGAPGSSFLHAQSSQATGPSAPSFAVVSIKPSHSAVASFNLQVSPGRFGVTYTRAKDLIDFAYNVRDSQILNMPNWASSERYDISAKVDDSLASEEQALPQDQQIDLMRLRVQSLLASRFWLSVHHTMTKLPVLVLVVAKNGPKFSSISPPPQPTSDPHGPTAPTMTMRASAKQWIVTFNGAPLSVLISALSGQPEISGRTLLDKTGLKGNYAFTLQWASENLTAGASVSPESQGPSLFTALQQQLGLKLESAKAPVDTIVIDHIERPSPN